MREIASESLVGRLYDAALDESLWPEVLDALMASTGSQAASLWVLHAADSPRLPVFNYRGFAPEFIEDYLQHWVPADPTVQFLVTHPEQRIVHDGLVISEFAKDRSAYYDWHARHSDTRFRMLAQVVPAAGVQAGVALHRAKSAGAYQVDELAQFEVLYAHLRRALSVSVGLGEISRLRALNHAMLEANPQAVVLLDDGGRCLLVNAKARELAQRDDGLRLAGRGGLVPSDPRRRAEFLALLPPAGQCRAANLRVARTGAALPYELQVVPLPREGAAWGGTAASMLVLVADPTQDRRPSAERLRQQYGLTPAEAALALRLAEGLDLRAAADQLGITYGSSRTRLKQVFSKTGASRQAELVRLVMLA